MANPNNVFKNMPKRPFDIDAEVRDRVVAEARVVELEAEGFETKVTTVRQKWTGVNRVVFRVWKREKKGAK